MIYTRISAFLLLFALTIGFIQCGDGIPDDPFANLPNILDVDPAAGISLIDVNLAKTNFNNFPFETLSDQERIGMRFVREEEKVAFDFYNTLRSVYDDNILFRMAQSEQTHFATAGLSFSKYSLPDPALGQETGVFEHTGLQAYYDALIVEGAPSLQDVFIASAKLQEASIVTLDNQLRTVANNRDLRHIYDALLIASKNHLKLMVEKIREGGVVYTPQYISFEEYQEIINGEFQFG